MKFLQLFHVHKQIESDARADEQHRKAEFARRAGEERGAEITDMVQLQKYLSIESELIDHVCLGS